MYGDAYLLEVNIDGQWRTVRETQDSSPEGRYSNSIRGVVGFHPPLRFEWEGLLPGDYRFSKTFYADSDKTISADVYAEFSIPEGLRARRPFAQNIQPAPAPDDFDVTMEFAGCTPRVVTVIITNNTEFTIRYGSGYELTGNQWGATWELDSDSYDLPPGGREEHRIAVPGIGCGEFIVKKNIIVEQGSGSAAAYKLSAEFIVANPAIPLDKHSLEIETELATPVGAVLLIINGFEGGRIYYDRSYRLAQMTGGVWQSIAAANSSAFADVTYSLAARQIFPLVIYWPWLYGDLPPGTYRIEKSFLHINDDGRETRHDLFAVFTLSADPVPERLPTEGGSVWYHPFAGVTTFRAEVTEHLDETSLSFGSQGAKGRLATSLAPVWDSGTSARFYIWDNYALTVLDADGNHIALSDIPHGAIADITFSGPVLTSNPGQILGALLIRLIEDA